VNEEFEKWFIAEYGEEPKGSSAAWNLTRVVCLRAWQASRKQTIDEAVEAAANAICECCFSEKEVVIAEEVIDAIRSLQKE
jgi:hypothetical protein